MSTRLPLCTGNNNKVLFLARCVRWQAHFELLHYLFCLWLSWLRQTSIPQWDALSKKIQSCTFLCLHWLRKNLCTSCIYKNLLFNWMQCFYTDLVQTAHIIGIWYKHLDSFSAKVSMDSSFSWLATSCSCHQKYSKKTALITDLKTNNQEIVHHFITKHQGGIKAPDVCPVTSQFSVIYSEFLVFVIISVSNVSAIPQCSVVQPKQRYPVSVFIDAKRLQAVRQPAVIWSSFIQLWEHLQSSEIKDDMHAGKVYLWHGLWLPYH